MATERALVTNLGVKHDVTIHLSNTDTLRKFAVFFVLFRTVAGAYGFLYEASGPSFSAEVTNTYTKTLSEPPWGCDFHHGHSKPIQFQVCLHS